jgi:hypothetical protein
VRRLRFRAEDQVLRRADAGAERDVLLDELRRIRGLRPAGADEVQRVAHDGLRHGHAAHQALERNQLGAADRPLEVRLEHGRRGADDVVFLVFRRMLDDDVEHEAIELGFRQRIGAFELDGILRRRTRRTALRACRCVPES